MKGTGLRLAEIRKNDDRNPKKSGHQFGGFFLRGMITKTVIILRGVTSA